VQRRHSISPLRLSVSALPRLGSPTVLSAATVVGNVLALDRWSQIALPLFRCLFRCPLLPFSSLERSTEHPRSTSGCVATGTHGPILSLLFDGTPEPEPIDRSIASSEYTRLPPCNSTTRRYPLDVIAHPFPCDSLARDSAQRTRLPSTPTATNRESGSLSCTHGRHGALIH
jgi:hypothetical protein